MWQRELHRKLYSGSAHLTMGNGILFVDWHRILCNGLDFGIARATREHKHVTF